MELLDFIVKNKALIFELSLEQLYIISIGCIFAAAIGVSIGVLITREGFAKVAPAVLRIAGIVETIPMFAMIGILVPVFGIGSTPTIATLVLYGLLPIIMNTYKGIDNVDPAVIEVARGMGMTNAQILKKVELPLALPVIITGLEVAIVLMVGISTLGYYIGAPGLGKFIFDGARRLDSAMILSGVVFVVLMAIGLSRTIRKSRDVLIKHW